MNLKLYTSVAKELKLNARKLWWLNPTFVEVTNEKLVEGAGAFCPPPPPAYSEQGGEVALKLIIVLNF